MEHARNKTRFAATRGLLLGITILLVILAAGCGNITTDPFGAKVGDLAPDFFLPTPGESNIRLSDYRGTPVMIYFWATWCGSCTFDLPDIDAAAKSAEDGNLEVITINIGEKSEKAEEFVLETVPDYSFKVATDPDAITFRDYRVLSIPITFFLDSQGIIRHIKSGRISEKHIEEGISRIS